MKFSNTLLFIATFIVGSISAKGFKSSKEFRYRSDESNFAKEYYDNKEKAAKNMHRNYLKKVEQLNKNVRFKRSCK